MAWGQTSYKPRPVTSIPPIAVNITPIVIPAATEAALTAAQTITNTQIASTPTLTPSAASAAAEAARQAVKVLQDNPIPGNMALSAAQQTLTAALQAEAMANAGVSTMAEINTINEKIQTAAVAELHLYNQFYDAAFPRENFAYLSGEATADFLARIEKLRNTPELKEAKKRFIVMFPFGFRDAITGKFIDMGPITSAVANLSDTEQESLKEPIRALLEDNQLDPVLFPADDADSITNWKTVTAHLLTPGEGLRYDVYLGATYYLLPELTQKELEFNFYQKLIDNINSLSNDYPSAVQLDRMTNLPPGIALPILQAIIKRVLEFQTQGRVLDIDTFNGLLTFLNMPKLAAVSNVEKQTDKNHVTWMVGSYESGTDNFIGQTAEAWNTSIQQAVKDLSIDYMPMGNMPAGLLAANTGSRNNAASKNFFSIVGNIINSGALLKIGLSIGAAAAITGAFGPFASVVQKKVDKLNAKLGI